MSNEARLPLRPRVPRFFNVVPMPEDHILLRSAHKTVVLGGKSIKAVRKLLGLLDGTRSLADITRCFPEILEQEVLTTIGRLAEKGLVEDASEPETKSSPKPNGACEAQETFFSAASGDGRLSQDILGKSRVAVFGLGRVGSHAVASLARSGIGSVTGVDDGVVESSLPGSGGLYLPEDTGRLRSEAIKERLSAANPDVCFESALAPRNEVRRIAEIVRDVELVLVCQDAPEVAVYRAVNKAALQEGVPWLRASLEGFEAQLGPAVIPRETACYTCYELRTKANWSYYDENLAFEQYLLSAPSKADYGCLAPVSGFLGNLAALESLKLLTGFCPPITCGRLFTFNISTFDAQPHDVLKLPRCPSCGATSRNPSTALWSL